MAVLRPGQALSSKYPGEAAGEQMNPLPSLTGTSPVARGALAMGPPRVGSAFLGSRFRLDIRRSFSVERGVRRWKRLHREVVKSSKE